MKGFVFAILVLCSLTAYGQLLNPAFVPLIPSVLGDDMFFTTSLIEIFRDSYWHHTYVIMNVMHYWIRNN